MTQPQYAAKIKTLDARIAVLQAQRQELILRKQSAAATPEKKRPKPKAPSKKKPANPTSRMTK